MIILITETQKIAYWMTNDPIKLTEEKILNNKVLTQTILMIY